MAFIPTILFEICLFYKIINCVGEPLDRHLNNELSISKQVVYMGQAD